MKEDNSLILVNQFGYIDSYGGPIKSLLGKLFEEYKSNFYIQMLIPQLEEYFNECVDKHFLRTRDNHTHNANGIDWKRKFKTKLTGDLFNNDIFNLRLYDKYPNFPQPLEPDSLDLNNREKWIETVKSYFYKLSAIMKKNNSGCNIYRFECLIEDFKYEGLSFKLFNVQNVKYLYYRTAEQINKIDSKNVQALFILPKIMLQTGLLKKISMSRRQMQCDFNAHSLNGDIKNNNDFSTILELENLENKKECSYFELKEFLVRDDKKSKELFQLYNNKKYRHALSCENLGEINGGFNKPDRKDIDDNTKEKEDEAEKHSAMKKKSKTSFLKEKSKTDDKKLDIIRKSITGSNNGVKPTESNISINKPFLNSNTKNIDNLLKIIDTNEKKDNPQEIEEIVIEDKPFKGKKKEKFFTENKRLIYKLDSLNPNETIEIQVNHEVKKFNDKKSPSNSSIQKEKLDRKNDLFHMINHPYIPRCLVNLKYNQLSLIVISLISFSLLAYFSTNILYSVEDALHRNTLMEKFKTEILESLMLTQESLIFANPLDFQLSITEGPIIDTDLYDLSNPPFDNLNEIMVSFYFENMKELDISVLSSISYLVDYLIETEKNDEIYQILLVNSMRIFQKLEGISNMVDITTTMINDIQKKLFVLSFLSIAIMALLVILQILNVFSAYSYINNVLKLFLSLPINDYKSLIEKILKYKEFKTSQKNSNSLNKSHIFDIKKFKFDTNVQSFNHLKEKNRVKKSVRLVAIQVKLPVLFLMLLGLFFIAIFSSFVIAILYESQMLDNSLINLLKNLSIITKTKSCNYQIFIRLTDKQFFNNSYGYQDSQNVDLLNNLQGFISLAFDENNNQFTNYNEIIKSSLCEDPLQNNECLKIGDGILTQGFL